MTDYGIDPRRVWRGLGRDLDRRYPPDPETPDAIERLMRALRQRDRDSGPRTA